jgi:glycosyltransferase involved in cell wall biosynthesis
LNANLTIARVIARLNVGGPAIQAILMTRVFRERGYNTLLLTGSVAPGETSMDYLALQEGVEFTRIATMSRRVSFLSDLMSLYRLIHIFRRECPTIVHTHTAKAGTLGRVAAILTGVPVRVHTFHGHVFSGYFGPVTNRFFIGIERLLARYTDRIVAISDSQRRDLVEVYKIAPGNKVVTIPLGLDLLPFLEAPSPVGRSAAGISGPRIAWVGRLTAIKCPELLVEAASLVHASCATARFVVVGDGDARQDLQLRIVNVGLTGVIQLLGSCDDMRGIYANTDLLLLTSRNEGTPVALLEAMASGKPFVATDVGGVRDLMVGSGREQDGFEIFDNGILAPVDCDVLARAVLFLSSQPDLCLQMGAIGRAHVLQRFSYTRLADDLERLYSELARTKRLLRSSPPVVARD